uniref:Uncharacterized protein n=1 Tax=Caenorhabditis japonica TaxID=281687 RepID=A0A8R1IRB9_CAEJA
MGLASTLSSEELAQLDIMIQLGFNLNPIENVWGLFARAVYDPGKQFQTVTELKDAVWDKNQPSYLESLTKNRNNRLFQVMRKFGKPSSY